LLGTKDYVVVVVVVVLVAIFLTVRNKRRIAVSARFTKILDFV
jgi:hypothetical protein